MATVWFTADTHFGHANIIKHCSRPFMNADELALHAQDPRGAWRLSKETLERHDDALLAAINECVGVDDTLWVLGDFCLGKFREAKSIRDRIRCEQVNLVWGNHDHRTIGQVFSKTIEQGMIKVHGQRVWLNHYPMRTWDGRFNGSWHLYGHVHGRLAHEDNADPTLLARDVGVDVCDYRPVSFEELQEYMKSRIAAFDKRRAAFLDGDDSQHIP